MTKVIVAIVTGYLVNIVGGVLAAIIPLAAYKHFVLSRNPNLSDGGWLAVTTLAGTLACRIVFIIEAGLLAFISGIILVKIVKKYHKNSILVMAALSSFSYFLLWSRFYPSLTISFLISMVTFFFVILGAFWSRKSWTLPHLFHSSY